MGRTIRQRRRHRGQHDRAAAHRSGVPACASTFQVGALSAAQWVPWLLIGLPAAVWVDRSRRRRLMLGCDVLRAVLVGSIPVAAAFNRLGMAQLFEVALLTVLATVVFQVAYLSYVPILL
ncbi:MAG: hypothetical protein DLM58_23870 [Pseudonocardiales bacterium]|nr:MAG: hypothetical protein DLM58_23870 [Pseudonocardiales bacterium]